MGKIRVKTLGDKDLEEKQKKESKKRKETKKVLEAPENKGDEQKLNQITDKDQPKVDAGLKEKTNKSKAGNKKQKTDNKKSRSKNYQTIVKLVDQDKSYSLTDALELLPKLKRAKFDETVEMHLGLTETGVSTTLNLPHGTGKKLRVAIATDDLIKEIEQGKINFDILLAEPQIMQKLAKVARTLGPKGLMPNPKNGTITTNPDATAKKFEAGQLTLKSESKFPIMHFPVGKVSFGEKKLEENIKTVFSSLPKTKIKNITLKLTMSPGIRINLLSL